MPELSANPFMGTARAAQPVKHGSRMARRIITSPISPNPPPLQFSGPADQVVLSTAAKAAAKSSFLKQAARFLFSKETFYRFWGEIAGAAVAGSFLLLANSKRWRV